MRPKATRVGDKCWRQVGDKCKLMRPKAGNQSAGKTSVGDKCKLMWPKAPRVGDKCGRQVWETSVNSCGPRHPEWETSVGDKCKLMRPKTPRVTQTSVGDKWETSVNSQCGRQLGSHSKCKLMETRVGDKWETSVNSCGPRHPEWETSVGRHEWTDKCERQVWETQWKQV